MVLEYGSNLRRSVRSARTRCQEENRTDERTDAKRASRKR
ncbi:hypothetical protein BN2537_10157 [Streptomyces venezuelae]|nr:hypothetical protein BN2537_10157 [Streptomyces venezuelae]